jgi:hypothetical protein
MTATSFCVVRHIWSVQIDDGKVPCGYAGYHLHDVDHSDAGGVTPGRQTER